eukprot:6826225-Ditylum_brightwellii.AAC.1
MHSLSSDKEHQNAKEPQPGPAGSILSRKSHLNAFRRRSSNFSKEIKGALPLPDFTTLILE